MARCVWMHMLILLKLGLVEENDSILFGIYWNWWLSKFLFFHEVNLFLPCFSPFQAILGGTIQVPTLTGNVVVKVCINYFLFTKQLVQKVNIGVVASICDNTVHFLCLLMWKGLVMVCRYALAHNLDRRLFWRKKVKYYLKAFLG